MQNNAKIGIIGGDMRQLSLSRRLSENGFEVAVWGLARGDIGGAVRCTDWRSSVEKSSAVILPLGAFKDGKYVINSSLGGEGVPLAELLYIMPKDAILLCPSPDGVVKRSTANHNIAVLDYFNSEELQIKNAIPTAEGAIEIAMRELPITINGSRLLVCGYGRIGKILSTLLEKLGAKVYVCARSESDLAYIEAAGNIPVSYTDNTFMCTAKMVDAVFNTVPARIIDKTVIENMSRCKLMVDLASGDGGIDFSAAEKSGIKCIHALALPGKVAPVTAGEILADSIYTMLLKKGVLPNQ
ncbi:MAG: dipicolinate synthase subunit DpsA [Clostridia bacterium]|nr:dipicolinate synthase subunit DpsA [Clostridia bacterium]